jgi:hypothetical protein
MDVELKRTHAPDTQDSHKLECHLTHFLPSKLRTAYSYAQVKICGK